jgi:gamma-glutamyltranspeptidase
MWPPPLALLLAIGASALPANSDGTSEGRRQYATGNRVRPLLTVATSTSTGGYISSTMELATLAGLQIMEAGGNAMDAAAAVQFALAVVQPQSNGLGGGAFILIRSGVTGTVSALDGREEAPDLFHGKVFCLDEDCLLNPECECTEGPIPFSERSIGGLPVGVPGCVAATARMLADNGTMSLAQVLAPSIVLARDGFAMYEGLFDSIAGNTAKLGRFEATRLLYLNGDGTAPRYSRLRPGHALDTVGYRKLVSRAELTGAHMLGLAWERPSQTQTSR